MPALPYLAPLAASSQRKNAIELVAVAALATATKRARNNRQAGSSKNKLTIIIILFHGCILPAPFPFIPTKPVNEVTGRQTAPRNLSRGRSSSPGAGFYYRPADILCLQCQLWDMTECTVAMTDVSKEPAAHFWQTTMRQS